VTPWLTAFRAYSRVGQYAEWKLESSDCADRSEQAFRCVFVSGYTDKTSTVQVPWGKGGEREGIAVRHVDGGEGEMKVVDESCGSSELRKKC